MRVVLTFILCLMVSTAWAEQLDTSLTAFGGMRLGGSVDVRDDAGSYEFEDSSSFGLIWNHRHDANTEWEVLVTPTKH